MKISTSARAGSALTSALLATLVTLGTLVLPRPASAQSIAESLSLLAEDNGSLYLSPVFEGLGIALGSGFSDDASVHDPLGFDVGVRVMGAFVPDEKKTFEAVVPSEVTFQGSTYQDPFAAAGGDLTTPTAVGEGEGIVLVPDGDYEAALLLAGEDPSDERYQIPFPDGTDVPAVPFVVLQASLGLGFNTDVTLRAIPEVRAREEIGDVKAFGIGAKHEVSNWFPTPLPADIAVSLGYQSFTVNEYMEGSTTSVGLLVGRGLGPLNVYVVGKNVSPEIDVSYAFENPSGTPGLPTSRTIAFSPELDSETRFGVGANLTFLVLNLSAQYTLGDYDVASVKLGVTFN